VILSPSDYVVKVFAVHGIPARRIYNTLDPAPFIYRPRRQLQPVFLGDRIRSGRIAFYHQQAPAP
jgi:hypothetical protein